MPCVGDVSNHRHDRLRLSCGVPDDHRGCLRRNVVPLGEAAVYSVFLRSSTSTSWTCFPQPLPVVLNHVIKTLRPNQLVGSQRPDSPQVLPRREEHSGAPSKSDITMAPADIRHASVLLLARPQGLVGLRELAVRSRTFSSRNVMGLAGTPVGPFALANSCTWPIK